MVAGIQVSDPNLTYALGAIIEPAVPFTHRLPLLDNGYFFVISGFIPSSAKQFTIDLSFNRKPQYDVTDIALHVKPWFEKGLVVRNSHVGGAWGKEELDGGLPLGAGESFQCCILVHKEHLKIAFNGTHFGTYVHRMPYESINELCIRGDVKLSSVYMKPGPQENPAVRQPALPPVQKVPPPDSKESESFIMQPGGYDLYLPYCVTIPKGMFAGRIIYVGGVPNLNAERFTVELCFDSSPEADVALHFDVRFTQSKIVRNSRKKKTWGKEELECPPFPFKRGKHFDICIWVLEKVFLISVGCQHLCSFKHRFSGLEHINTLKVMGEMELNHVRIR